MANLPEAPTYDIGVYQLETTDPCLGGPDGCDNAGARNLANRTAYLKAHLDTMESIVPQAEAEAGTAETLRGWTALRVRQAINAVVDPIIAALGLKSSISQVQSCTYNTALAGGTADAITATFSPGVTELTDGIVLRVKAVFANNTTTPTFQADSLAAYTIVKGPGIAINIGDISGPGHRLELCWDSGLLKWILLNPFIRPATQADQESSSAGPYVTPETQRYHPSAAKGWILFSGSGITLASYNCDGVTVVGPGNFGIGISIDMSSNNYPAFAQAQGDTDSTAVGNISTSVMNSNHLAPSFGVQTRRMSDYALTDVAACAAYYFGDQ